MPKGIDPELAKKTFELDKFEPKIYELDIDFDFGTKKTQLNSQILLIGDTHVGSIITSQGNDPTPLKTAQGYFDVLWGKIVKFYQEYEFDVLINTKFYIFLLGDLVEGEDIYLGQKSLPTWQQVKKVVEMIYDLTQKITALGFKSVDIYSVMGNHGRMPSKFVDQSTNWDNMVGYTLKSWYHIHHENDSMEHVNVHWTTQDFNIASVDKWKFGLFHGKFGGRGGGFNIHKIEEKFAAWKHVRFPQVNCWTIGHWHQLYAGNVFNIQYFLNGTTYDSDYVRKDLAKEQDFKFWLLEVGEDLPIKSSTVLDLSEATPPNSHFNL